MALGLGVSHLDAVFDLAGVVSDDEGRLHDSGKLHVAVPFMLPLELVQQGLVAGLGKAEPWATKWKYCKML